MATLYELTESYKALLDLGDSPDPDDQQAFLDTLEGLDFEVGLKADAYASVISQLEGRADMINAEIDRLKAFADAAERSIERMKHALLEAMQSMDKKEIKTDLHRFRVVRNGGKAPLMIVDENIPAEYQRTVVTVSPDKEKIRKALEDGVELPFASLMERGSHLRID